MSLKPFNERVCDRSSERGRENPSKVSKKRELGPAEVLRRARESRYSRDQEALSASLSCCTAEPNVLELQIAALERVKTELETRMRQYKHQLHNLRERLASQAVEEDDSRESLLRQRLVVEHGLAAAHEEAIAVFEKLEQLRLSSHPPVSDPTNRQTISLELASRRSANLSLFLRNSATKRPFQKSLRPLSADHIRKNGLPQYRRFAHSSCSEKTRSNLRTRSLIEGYYMDKLHTKEVRHLEPSSFSSGVPRTPRSEQSFACTPDSLPVVDEFSNSFSLRVIAPPRSRPKPRSSLRPLHTSSRERRNMFNGPRITPTDSSEYGNVTLLPRAIPRSKSDLLDDLPSTPLPSYVQSLIAEFEQSSAPPLALSVTDQRNLETPTPQKRAPLSPVSEQPSSQSSIRRQPSPLTQPSPKPTGRKLLKKQRSIFTLRLPLRPSVPGSPSRSTLAASSSTSVSESTNEHPLAMPLVHATLPLQPKGLPSTRDHDLAMLDGALDDIPDSPLPIEPATPTAAKSRTSRSFAMLRGVKSRLVQLGRL